MFPYDVHQLSKIYYEERLQNAAQNWRFRHVGNGRDRLASLVSERLGDWFINIGMKLKAQQGSPTMGTHLAHR